ncbi:MAG TPA: carboxypeptidase-like regulatory domain-containing protein, partial [Pseudobacter sp.]|nr:carboxypeptidase-like regulatory domain-containing protein [Pseudobacter sp.]
MKGWKLLLLLLLSLQGISHAQTKVLKGTIKDAHSDERVPFASMQLLRGGNGRVSDSSGAFIFRFDHWPSDTIKVTYVGFQDFYLVIDSALVSKEKNGVIDLTILLERGKFTEEVVVKRTIDRGYLMWKRIVKHKPKNDRYRFQNFSYELYNKLEIDLKNIKRDK